jgi:hypothetical protein
MKRPTTMQANQLEKFADFLEAHPAFSPVLYGEDGLVCGFFVGKCFLTLHDMERLLAASPDSRLASLLIAPVEQVRKP